MLFAGRKKLGYEVVEDRTQKTVNNCSNSLYLSQIFIPQLTQQVYIHGEISNSGAIRYAPGKDIDYYLNKSGGALLTADLNNIFIVHPNGETENFADKSRLSFIIDDSNKELIYPGSIIYIPQKTNYANSLQVASIWAPIISSIALSLTSLSVLNNNN